MLSCHVMSCYVTLSVIPVVCRVIQKFTEYAQTKLSDLKQQSLYTLRVFDVDY